MRRPLHHHISISITPSLVIDGYTVPDGHSWSSWPWIHLLSLDGPAILSSGSPMNYLSGIHDIYMYPLTGAEGLAVLCTKTLTQLLLVVRNLLRHSRDHKQYNYYTYLHSSGSCYKEWRDDTQKQGRWAPANHLEGKALEGWPAWRTSCLLISSGEKDIPAGQRSMSQTK